jgi:hypothetical protein
MSAAIQTIFRTEKTAGYSKVSNDLWTLDLSIGARLTLGYMLSKPDSWRFYIEVIAKELRINKDTAASYVNELINAGYVKRERRRENGRFAGWTYYVFEAIGAGNNADSTVSEDSVSGDSAAIITDVNITELKQEEDINTTQSLSKENETFTVIQEEIYDQAIENGFRPDTARLFALRCEGLRVTITTIANAFKALIDRMNDRTQPRIVSLPAYFRVTLEDEMERQAFQGQERKKREERVAQVSDWKPYNWLEEIE